MDSISKTEQRLYNTYLATSRSCRNKPFKIRQDFSKFEGTQEHQYIKRISYFLSQFPQIKPDIFFKAPYELYKDHDYFALDYYVSPKAIRSYSLYMKQLQEQSPDTNDQLDFIRDSLKFVGMFCMKEKISLNDYITYKGQGITYCWLKHVMQHNVSIYTLMESNIMPIIESLPLDEQDLFLGDLAKNFYAYKNRYLQSNMAKLLVKEGMKKVNASIEKNTSEVSSKDSNIKSKESIKE